MQEIHCLINLEASVSYCISDLPGAHVIALKSRPTAIMSPALFPPHSHLSHSSAESEGVHTIRRGTKGQSVCVHVCACMCVHYGERHQGARGDIFKSQTVSHLALLACEVG